MGSEMCIRDSPYRMSYRSPWWLLRLRLSSLSAVAPLLYTERVPQKAFRVVSAGAFGAETKTLGRRKAYLVRVNLYSPQSVQTGEGYPLTRNLWPLWGFCDPRFANV